MIAGSLYAEITLRDIRVKRLFQLSLDLCQPLVGAVGTSHEQGDAEQGASPLR
jgi:hypothetical protein